MVGNAFVLKCWRGSLKDLKSKGSWLQSLDPKKKWSFQVKTLCIKLQKGNEKLFDDLVCDYAMIHFKDITN
jgi:hypothetical protein